MSPAAEQVPSNIHMQSDPRAANLRSSAAIKQRPLTSKSDEIHSDQGQIRLIYELTQMQQS